MRKIMAAVAAATLLSTPALAQTVIIDEAAPTTTTTTTTVVEEVPTGITTYVRENPIDAAPVLEGRLVNGTIVPQDVDLVPVRGYDGYSYFYQDGAPVIVNSQRKVVQIVR